MRVRRDSVLGKQKAGGAGIINITHGGRSGGGKGWLTAVHSKDAGQENPQGARVRAASRMEMRLEKPHTSPSASLAPLGTSSSKESSPDEKSPIEDRLRVGGESTVGDRSSG